MNFFMVILPQLICIFIPKIMEASAICGFVDFFALRKYRNSEYYLVWFLLCTVWFYFAETQIPVFSIRILLTVLFFTLSIWGLYETQICRSAMIAIGFAGCCFVISVLFSEEILKMLGTDIYIGGMEFIYLFFVSTMGKFVFMLTIKLMNGIGGHKKNTKAKSEDVFFLFLMVFLFLEIYWMLFMESLEDKSISAWNVYLLLGLVILCIASFHITDLLQRHYEAEVYLSSVNAHMRAEMENIAAVQETHEKIKRISHGITNQLFAVETLLHNDKFEEAEKYLEMLVGTVEQHILPVHTNNVVIDALLNQKYILATSKRIKMVFDIQDLQEPKIYISNLVAILSNALNNAIEACEKVTGDRVIELQIINENNEMIISIENTIEKEVTIVDNHIPTTKSDKENHGIGLGSIRGIVEQHGGKMFLDSEGNRFKLLIVL